MEIQRDSKLGYGFLFVGAASPYLTDKLFGPTFSLVIAAVELIAGIVFLLAAHHNRLQPRRSLVMTILIFTLYGAGIGAFCGGIVGAIAHLRTNAMPTEHNQKGESGAYTSAANPTQPNLNSSNKDDGDRPTNVQNAKLIKREAISDDMALPIVVKAYIHNDGIADITNIGKVPIEDIQVDFSWHMLNQDYTYIRDTDDARLKPVEVKDSSFSNGHIHVSDQELQQDKKVQFDLKKVVHFMKFPADTAEEWQELCTKFYVFRFTFRDARTKEKYACFTVHSAYLYYPSGVNDDVASAGTRTYMQFNDAIPGIVISAAKDHYRDGAKVIQCER